MDEQPNKDQQSDPKVSFQLNLDKEMEDSTAKLYIQLIAMLNSYYAATRRPTITASSYTDDQGNDLFFFINSALDQTVRLFLKFNEPGMAEEVIKYRTAITGQLSLPTLDTIKQLRTFNDQLALFAAKKNMRDSTTDKPPWEQTVREQLDL